MNTLKNQCASVNKLRNSCSLISGVLSCRFSTGRLAFAKNHYNVLGITSQATQTDVKTAYYKLSMIYHPDKNKGSSDAADRFRDITAAYEILSSYRLRRLYDKGIIHTAGPQYKEAPEDTVVPDVEDDPQTKFYKRHMTKTETPHVSGRTPIYNFDEWAEAHYGSTFNRRKTAQLKYRNRAKEQTMDENDMKTQIFIFGILTAIGVMLILVYKFEQASLDRVADKKVK